ncbi:manganese and iron superoxide dismutase [Clavulina sp. PMI_390]|nr:manganese and iron superoxide dismutase [Clavulina sp. PMI_390]
MRPFASTSKAVLAVRVAGSRRALRIPTSFGARSRSLHTLPPYPYAVENGMGNFLSPNALRTVAVDYQAGLLSRLNDLIRGDPLLENLSVVGTVITAAQDSSRILPFNLASQALNNSFFLDNLAPPREPATNHEDEILFNFATAIKTEFGSLAQFKSNFSAAALGMMSSGWVWLVMDSNRRLAILPTYGAGTVLARGRQQALPRYLEPTVDRNAGSPSAIDPSTVKSRRLADPFSSSTPSSATSQTSSTSPFDTRGQIRQFSIGNPSLSAASEEDKSSLFNKRGEVYSSWAEGKVGGEPPSNTGPLLGYGAKLTPLFCLSVHEHAWLSDYGVWGKEEYLKNFWNVLNWGQVSQLHYELSRPRV